MEISKHPFPHASIRDAIPADLVRRILAEWPEPAAMADEGGGLERHFYELIHDDALLLGALPNAAFWATAAKTIIETVYAPAAQSLGAWIAAKFGKAAPRTIDLQVHRMMCLQAGAAFTEHPPHAHSAAPNWVMTCLLYIDDAGRTDRGTSLYAITRHASETPASILANHHPAGAHVRAADRPFEPGAALCFLDSAVSVHGSTPFVNHAPGRKIIRAHVALAPGYAPKLYGMPVAEMNAYMVAAIDRYLRDKDGAVFRRSRFALFDRQRRPRLDAEVALAEIIRDARAPAAADAAFRFPVLTALEAIRHSDLR
jgi:hypothetical protein